MKGSNLGIPATIYSIENSAAVPIKIAGTIYGTVGTTLDYDTIRAYSAAALTHTGQVVDGGTAIAHKFGNANALSTTGAKIASFYSDNATTEKAYIDKNGLINASGGFTIGTCIFSYGAGTGALAIGVGASGGASYGVGIGAYTLYACVGTKNVAIGDGALRASYYTNYNYNSAFGVNAGYANYSDYNLFLGYQAGQYNNRAYSLYIAVTNTALPLILGHFDTSKLKIHGDVEITSPATLGPECLSEIDFATHALWDTTGLCNDTGGNAVFTGVGTLTQTQANLATALVGNRWYKFSYTVSAYTSPCVVTITTGICDEAVTLRINNTGTFDARVYTKSSPGDFVISLASGTLTLDDLSLKEIQGGTLTARAGILNHGNIDSRGAATFNDDSADVDFRVESNGDANALVVDGGNDNVGIGVAADGITGKAHIKQVNASGAKPVLTLEQADISEEFERIIGESAADNTCSLVDAADLSVPGAIVGWKKIYVEDKAAAGAIVDGYYWIPFYATPTAP